MAGNTSSDSRAAAGSKSETEFDRLRAIASIPNALVEHVNAGHLWLDEFVTRRDDDSVPYRSCNRTPLGVERVHPFNGVVIGSFGSKPVMGMNPLDDENPVLEFDLTGDLGDEASMRSVDSTRLQRAPEGAGESPTGGRHDVVQGRRVGRILLCVNAVVLRYLGMDSKGERFGSCRQVSLSQWAPLPDNAHARSVNNLAQGSCLQQSRTRTSGLNGFLQERQSLRLPSLIDMRLPGVELGQPGCLS